MREGELEHNGARLSRQRSVINSMQGYKIIVEGRHCLMQVDGSPTRCGFFATRVLTANDVDEAKKIVLQAIRSEIAPLLLNDEVDPPSLEISELQETSELSEHPPKGFSWYIEDEN